MLFLFIQFVQIQSYVLINQTTFSGEKELRMKFSASKYEENLLFVFLFSSSFQKAYITLDNIDRDQLETDNNIFIDIEAFQSRNLTQFIEISVEEIEILHIIILGETLIDGRLEIYQKNLSNCINQCQGQNVQQIIDSQVCSGERCICNEENMGNYCQFQRQRITVGHLMTLELVQNQWTYLQFKYDHHQTLTLQNIPVDLYVSYGIDIQGFEIPRYEQLKPFSQYTNVDDELNQYKKFDFKHIIVGLFSKRDQQIQIVLKEEQIDKSLENDLLFILFVVFNIFIISGWYWGFRARKYDEQTERRLHKKQNHLKQLDEAIIDQYFLKLKYIDLLITNPEYKDIQICAICQCIIYETTVTITPCKHLFHLDCIKMWLLNEANCPNCRFVISCEVLEKRIDKTKDIIDRSVLFQSSFQSISDIN